MDIVKNTRATLRAVVGLAAIPVAIGLAALQGFVVGPLTGNYSVIPNLIYKGMRELFGYKIAFNKASAPMHKGSTWFVANHQSIADFIVLGSTLNGTFGGKGDILKWPGVAQMARAVRYIGFRRSSEYNEQSRAKLIKNFNDGFNTIMFPEGTRVERGQKGQYKSGGTRLAIDTGVPVIPIAVTSAKVWPRKAFIKKPGVVDVSIGPAIASAGRQPDELMREVEAWIEAEMRRLDPEAYPAEPQPLAAPAQGGSAD